LPATTAIPATAAITAPTIATPGIIADTSISLFRLPRELRDYIYTYVSFNEATWIGSPPLVAGQQDVIIEENTMQQPATSTKTHSSIIITSSEVRDEFRTAVWRSLITSDRQADLRLYDFTPAPISDFFASCSPSELQTLLVGGKCRVHIHLTGVLHTRHLTPQLRLKISLSDVIMAWVSFCLRIGLETTYSLHDRCDWDELMLAESGLQNEMVQKGVDMISTHRLPGWQDNFFYNICRHMARAAEKSRNRRIKNTGLVV
jgi:hypothetical protein